MPQAVFGNLLQLVRRPMAEIQRASRAELERVARCGDVVQVKLSTTTPGLVSFQAQGKVGSYPVTPGQIPLKGTMVIDSPTAETGQCGEATFPGPKQIPYCRFNGSGSTLLCK